MSRFYKKILIILLVISFGFRFFRLSNPQSYIFDEVYHVVTAQAYSQNNKEAYNPFSTAPEPNTAYDWLHPPLAKLIQATSIKLLGDNSFAWRFPSVIFGTLSILALYYLADTLFKNQKLSLISATIFSLSNLQLTMSRITMNDIFVTTFIILAFTFFYKVLRFGTFSRLQEAKRLKDSSEPSKYNQKYLFLTGLFTGLALATKWSSLFLYPIFFIFLVKKMIKNPKKLFYCFAFLGIVPILIYFLSYTQYFLLGYTLKDFFHLHQQIYWYQTSLTATHGYQSSAWQWPFLIRPVWFHVQYFKDSVAHIYNLGNPAIFWGGLVALGFRTFSGLQRAKRLILLTSYFLLFIPWLFSPRILFLHHYLPALPFLCLIIAQTIYQNKKLTTYYLALTAVLFLFFYPLNTAIPISNKIINLWFWFPTWK